MNTTDITNDLDNILKKLETYEYQPKQRAYYEGLFLRRLQDLRSEPAHVWKPYVLAYTKYEKW